MVFGGAGTSLKEIFTMRDYPMLDSEVFTSHQGFGYSILTIDYGSYILSPLDTYDRLNLYNLKNNVEAAICIVFGILSIDNLRTEYLGNVRPTEVACSIAGRVVKYNEATDWFDPIPNALVAYRLHRFGSKEEPKWPRPRFTIADENGNFLFSSIFAFCENQFEGDLHAFVLNETTGEIIYAPTQGRHMWFELTWRSYPGAEVDPSSGVHGMHHPHDLGFLVLFKCASVILFDIMSPQALSSESSLRVGVVDTRTKITPDSYGIFENVFFVPPNIPLAFVLKMTYERSLLGVIYDTYDEKVGKVYGYTFNVGEQRVFHNPTLRFAACMYQVAKRLVDDLRAHVPVEEKIVEELKSAGGLLEQAEEALNELNYTGFYVSSNKAWSQILDVYRSAYNLKGEAVNTILFFSFILIVFTFLFERMIIHAEGKKRILSLLIIAIVFNAIFYFIHPGFYLASNPVTLILAYVVFVMMIPPIYTVFSYVQMSLREFRVKTIGRHVMEISRSSAAVLSFQTGIENLRKRKLLSSLTLFTIIMITIGIVIFSSFSSLETTRTIINESTPLYQGVYIRDPAWNGLSQQIIDYLKSAYSNRAEIVIRSWLYTQTPSDPSITFTIRHGDNVGEIYAITGLTSSFIDVYPIFNMTGRWFLPDEDFVCVIPSSIAEEIGASLTDTIEVIGLKLKVVGIVDDKSIDYIADLDGEPITPYDQQDPEILDAHVLASQTIFVPFKLLEPWRPTIASVSIIPYDPNLAPSIVEDLVRNFNFHVRCGVGDKIIYYSPALVVTVFGWQIQIVPIVLATLIMVNLMISETKIREREILTYSVVGLSPLHILFMFLAESLIYAVIGGVLGYISAGLISLATGIHFGYYSTFVASVLCALILITMASAIYPSIKASRLVTPSLERLWRIPTSPVGNKWEIPFPIIFKDKKELRGACNYLIEYIESMQGEASVFLAENIGVQEEDGIIRVSMHTQLAPYELNVKQDVDIAFIQDFSTKEWHVNLVLKRTSGTTEDWIRLVRRFADEIRKQFLYWRSLSREEKLKYMKTSSH